MSGWHLKTNMKGWSQPTSLAYDISKSDGINQQGHSKRGLHVENSSHLNETKTFIKKNNKGWFGFLGGFYIFAG